MPFDAATDLGQTTATSLTAAHTCTGSNRILHVGFTGDVTDGGADDVSSVTYNAVGMTLVGKLAGAGARWTYLYILVAPATGSNNVVITCSSSHQISGLALSHTDMLQSGQPNIFGTEDNAGSGIPQTETVTTTVDNCWLVMFGAANNGAVAASTGATLRVKSAWDINGIFDSNGPKTPAGAHSIAFTGTDAPLASVTSALAPAGGGGGGAATGGFRSLLGVGR